MTPYHGRKIAKSAELVAVLNAHNLEAVWHYHALALLELCRDAFAAL
jgi:hypothetical protein